MEYVSLNDAMQYPSLYKSWYMVNKCKVYYYNAVDLGGKECFLLMSGSHFEKFFSMDEMDARVLKNVR